MTEFHNIEWDNISNKKSPIYRLKKRQIRDKLRVYSSIDYHFKHVMLAIDHTTSRLAIPQITDETAKHIYCKVIEKRLIKGYFIEAMVGASIVLSESDILIEHVMR